MRDIPYHINEKLGQRVQTKATNSDPRLSLWISRPTTQLTEAEFLEYSAVQNGVSAASIAVRHMSFGNSSDVVYIGYIKNSNAYVACSPTYVDISRHTWTDTGFITQASDIAIAFDGTMPRDVHGNYEFITKNAPWVFWVSDGAAYGQILGQPGTVTLAESNATKVAAVRAMWSDVPGFDFGLVLFMVVNGEIYYRQLIDGIWSDAEPVNFGPSVVWSQISAQRTWDYRIALQAVDSTGALYELFTQYGGIGSKNAEHIAVKDITAKGNIVKVNYSDTKSNDEHIELSDIITGAPYGGLYSTGTPSIVSVRNIADSNGDWGKILVVTFDIHLKSDEVSAQAGRFTITDNRNTTFTASEAVLGADGKTITLMFTDFNNCSGACYAKYTAGTVTSMFGVALPTAVFSFTPTNLIPNSIPAPEVVEVFNI